MRTLGLLWCLLLGVAWGDPLLIHLRLDHPCTVRVQRQPVPNETTTPVVYAQTPVNHVDIHLDRLNADYVISGHDNGFFVQYQLPEEPVELTQGDDTRYLHPRATMVWSHLLLIGVPIALGLAGLMLRSLMHLRRQQALVHSERERLNTRQVATGLFPADGSLPERIPPYRVVARLGAGGMAVVYRVENAPGEQFALKLPFPNLLQDAKYMQRFTREAKIGIRLRHPNLVSLLAVNDDTNPECPYPYLVMELVEGTPLDAIFEQKGRLTVEEALPILRDVLAGLRVVHANGVVHRDIKPGNIMVGESGRARLMDFGVAHKQDTAGGKLTGTEEILGTVRYMAPEQVATRPLDGRTDIYTVGVVLYELLAGTIPYGTDDVYLILGMKCTMPLPPIRTYCQVDARLDALIDRMVAIDPADRPANVDEVLTALLEVGNDGVDGQEGAQQDATDQKSHDG